jgi:hypothetical protein
MRGNASAALHGRHQIADHGWLMLLGVGLSPEADVVS